MMPPRASRILRAVLQLRELQLVRLDATAAAAERHRRKLSETADSKLTEQEARLADWRGGLEGRLFDPARVAAAAQSVRRASQDHASAVRDADGAAAEVRNAEAMQRLGKAQVEYVAIMRQKVLKKESRSRDEADLGEASERHLLVRKAS